MIEVARAATANVNIAQFKVEISPRKKKEALKYLIETDNVSTAIIFANRKTTVRELNKDLRRAGFRSGEIHGDMDQASRIAELDLFKKGEVNILVASDVAARGLDVKGVSHVFNYDTPWHPDDYVHRIGRTGRAGAKGRAITLVTPADAEALDNVEKLTGIKVPPFDWGSVSGQGEGKSDAPASKTESGDERDAGGKPARSRRRKSDSPKAEAAPREKEAASPAREEKPARKPRAQQREVQETSQVGEWNGPRPSFLEVGFD